MPASGTVEIVKNHRVPVTADLHVHSEWSWDATLGSMEMTCARAVELGLGAVAFTEHADYSPIAAGAQLDVEGYRESIARCQRLFPQLQIWSGVELGEPHRFPRAAADVLLRGDFDLVLGSLHCIVAEGQMLDCSTMGGDCSISPEKMMREYFQETLRLLATPLRSRFSLTWSTPSVTGQPAAPSTGRKISALRFSRFWR